MAAHMDESTEKERRKINKKLWKVKDQLARKENVIVCEKQTKILCVQNGGLDNGVSQDELYKLLTKFGPVEDIIMLPRKAYCFACYFDVQSAAAAQDHLTGYLLREGKDPSQNITLYLFFVASAPASVCPSSELPAGLLLLKDFISKETESLLLRTVNFESEKENMEGTGGSLKHREVKHYGFEFKYGINNVNPNEPLQQGIPEECHELLHRALDSKIVAHFPDQLTVNRYLPGQGIPPHVDTPSAFEDGIMSLSCGSQVIMDFRHPDGRHLAVLVPPRSLLVMTGESRYVWTHGITPRKSDIVPSSAGGVTLAARGTRTSFTFRKLSTTAGIIPPEQKDSLSCLPKTEEEAVALEKQHVHEVYEEIADHFSDTRHKPWPQIEKFLLEQPLGSILLDSGCGNGKYLCVNSQLCQIGSDRSENLAGICQSRGFQVFIGDVLAIPVRTGCIDVGLCIAVIHHLSTEARRKQAIQELIRVLRPEGCVLIYVWAKEQLKDNQKSKYIKPHKKNKHECEALPLHTQHEEKMCASVKSSCKELCGHSFCEREVDSVTQKRDACRPTTGDCLEGDRENKSKEQGEQCLLHNHSQHVQDQTGEEQLQVHVNRTEFKKQDMLVPWQLKKGRHNDQKEDAREQKTFHRFYHVFEEGELEALCSDVSGCLIKTSYYDQGNWCVVLQKL